jgi:PRTRC genetic system ThiF family protein
MKKQNLLSSTPAPVRLHIPDFTRVLVTLVGCGGTGSHIASGLVAIAEALDARDIVLNAVLIDPDVVEERNVGRQLFARADIGKHKAVVVAERLNAAFGTRFGALARTVESEDLFYNTDNLRVVIGAVDNPAARATIAQAVAEAKGRLWWLDAGNENHSGQVALGNIADARDLRGAVALGLVDRLPAPTLVYPDLIKTPRRKRPRRAPSCAELTASGEQALMVNRVVAAWACELLAAFLIAREVKWFALALDLAWGGTRAYTLDVPTLAEVTGLKGDQLVVKGKR